jgi:transglutaminase-like putative cysteine protease
LIAKIFIFANPETKVDFMTYSRILFFFWAILPSTYSFSQISVKKAPANSWIEKITFDKNAVPTAGQESSYYYLLLDEQENIALQESYLHYAYKILTNEGLQQMADLSFDFDPSYEKFTLHNIVIHRGTQQISQLSNEVRTLQREQSMDRHLYDGSVTAVTNLTDVRVGDIVEYSFTRKGYNPVYGNYLSRKISFNYSMAYAKAFQRLIAPASMELSFQYVNEEKKPLVKKSGLSVDYSWSLGRVNGLLSDNYEPDWYNPYSYVLITNLKNWAEVAKWSVSRHEVSKADLQKVAETIVPKFNGVSKAEYALQAVRFVQDDIRYLGFESGLNSHKPHPPVQVYDQRFGDCKDKSLLLATLLNAKGIPSRPVLVNTTYRNKIADQLPSVNAFDHCIVQLNLDDRLLYIDPTISNQGGTLDQYYFPVYGKGLVVDAATKDLADFPQSVHSSIWEKQTFDLKSIGGEGMMGVETTYSGAEADNQRAYFSTNALESIQKQFLTYYGNVYPDIQKFEDIKIEDDRASNIFVVKEKYKIPAFWKPYPDQEEKIYCEFYPLALESHFKVSKSSQRTAPYRLTYPLDYTHETHVNLPEKWTISHEEDELNSESYDYTYKVDYSDWNKRLSLVTHYKTKKDAVPVDDFSKFVSDHEKMMGHLSYSLSYDKAVAERASAKWPGVVFTVIILLSAAGLVFWLYKNYDPRPIDTVTKAEPIGGWLILVAFGLSLTPLRLFFSFITEDYLLNGQGWLSMWYLKNYKLFAYLLFVHIYNVAYLLFSTLVVILFFQRRSSVPMLVTIQLVVSCIVLIVDNFIAREISPGTELDIKGMMQSVIGATIWVPYFHLSERVKETFVNMYRNDDTMNDDSQHTYIIRK